MTEEINLIAEKVKETFMFLSQKLDAPVKYLWNVTLLSIRIKAAVEIFTQLVAIIISFLIAYNLNNYIGHLEVGKLIIGLFAVLGSVMLLILFCTLGQNITNIFTPEYTFLKKFLNYRNGIRFE